MSNTRVRAFRHQLPTVEPTRLETSCGSDGLPFETSRLGDSSTSVYSRWGRARPKTFTLVLSVTEFLPVVHQLYGMETTVERRYKVLRKLPDGEQLLIGRFEDMNEARRRVAAFSEYWPGDYVIVPPKYEQAADR